MQDQQQYPIKIEQGVRFTLPLRWTTLSDPQDPNSARIAVNMTGMGVRSEMKTRDGEVIGAFTVAMVPEQGRVTLSLTDAETKALAFDDDYTGVFDVEVSQNGQVIKRLLRGTVTLIREVTDEEAL